jgi:membrane protein
VSLIISAILAFVEESLNVWLPMAWVWRLANIVVSYLVVTFIFMAIYKVLPDVKITWRDVAVGAAVTAFLFSLGKYFIGLYLGKWTLASSYGAAGSFVVLLIWIYYSALICFFGAEFTQVYARRYGSQIRPNSQAVRIGEKSDVA